ncbi:MAG: nucleoside-diphosphate kinase, partial [bacterium]|nr:nucleoside-diphosphate kinase [bacterium]
QLEKTLIASINDIGLTITKSRTLMLDDAILEVVYQDLKEKHFYRDLVTFMKSGPAMALLVKGPNAIAVMNWLKRELRQRHKDSWIDLTEEDLRLWDEGRHPNQQALNIRLVAANLLHVCDFKEESERCSRALFAI